MSFDFKLDKDTHDLIISSGDLIFTNKVDEEVGQRVDIRLNTFETEWFIDLDYGVPYSQEIIGKARNKKDVDTIFLNEVREEEGVNGIDSYSSIWDRSLRTYKIDVSILTNNGTIPITSEVRPQSEWIYPNFGDDNPSNNCGLDQLPEYVDRLYEFININGLPAGTYSSWVNNWV